MGIIRELMTVNPRTVQVAHSVVHAAKLMRGEDSDIAPVLDGRELVGVVTDRDIAVRVVAEGRDPSTTCVGDVASHSLVTIDPDQSFDDALRLMARHCVNHLPVVEEDGKLIGIVSRDVVARYASSAPLAEIAE
jgi:CBS domain-containing protein